MPNIEHEDDHVELAKQLDEICRAAREPQPTFVGLFGGGASVAQICGSAWVPQPTSVGLLSVGLPVWRGVFGLPVWR